MNTQITPDTLTLSPGDALIVKGWLFPAIVNTARAYGRRYNEDQEAAHQREKSKGYPTAWTNRAPAILDTDGSANRERLADVERAILVKGGEVVTIEGERYVLKVNGPRYADPIRFDAI